MTILSKKPLTLSEVGELIGKDETKEEIREYIKKFNMLTKEKSEKLKTEILGMGNVKVNEEHAVKIVDFLPKESEELNKIFVDTSLTEEETNAILEVVRKY
jgi:DNA-directed RNA polymerase subunit F